MKKHLFGPFFLVVVVAFFASSFAMSVRPEPIAGNYDLFRDSTGRLSAIEAYYGDDYFAYQNT